MFIAMSVIHYICQFIIIVYIMYIPLECHFVIFYFVVFSVSVSVIYILLLLVFFAQSLPLKKYNMDSKVAHLALPISWS